MRPSADEQVRPSETKRSIMPVGVYDVNLNSLLAGLHYGWEPLLYSFIPKVSGIFSADPGSMAAAIHIVSNGLLYDQTQLGCLDEPNVDGQLKS